MLSGMKFFRLDYDLIKKIMGSFKGQEATTQQTIQKLSKVIEQLRGGDWYGEGATAFFNEMDSEVMPAMKRLQNAMGEADRVSKEIERLQKETENTVSSFFTAIANGFGSGIGTSG
ncbi:MAG TPA: WXG100 family type VII secretion target [Anaerolineales bacterium]|nr:WXG100 family type VII secretion target [Anaerolineales bacterium]